MFHFLKINPTPKGGMWGKFGAASRSHIINCHHYECYDGRITAAPSCIWVADSLPYLPFKQSHQGRTRVKPWHFQNSVSKNSTSLVSNPFAHAEFGCKIREIICNQL